MTERKLPKDEASLLLFFEASIVEHSGAVQSARMNDEDRAITEKWNEEGFIVYRRLPAHYITDTVHQGATRATHYVSFSEEAFAVAQRLRIERARRKVEAFMKKMQDEYGWEQSFEEVPFVTKAKTDSMERCPICGGELSYNRAELTRTFGCHCCYDCNIAFRKIT